MNKATRYMRTWTSKSSHPVSPGKSGFPVVATVHNQLTKLGLFRKKVVSKHISTSPEKDGHTHRKEYVTMWPATAPAP